ncbi:MAG TPA: SRPBCC domain-containing protein [Chryseobacterium sp.]|nr:SRPBCC domain-containing protein [Chryseobacterium sp.]
MPDITHALLIGASAEKIYEMLTTQEGLSEWWTPNTKANTVLNSIAYFPFGPGYFKEMLITELKPFELIRWTCMKGADEWVGTEIVFRLIPGDKEFFLKEYPAMQGQVEQLQSYEGILLIFSHHHWKSQTLMLAECNYTWGQFLRSLKLLCETGRGKPWPNQHR